MADSLESFIGEMEERLDGLKMWRVDIKTDMHEEDGKTILTPARREVLLKQNAGDIALLEKDIRKLKWIQKNN